MIGKPTESLVKLPCSYRNCAEHLCKCRTTRVFCDSWAFLLILWDSNSSWQHVCWRNHRPYT